MSAAATERATALRRGRAARVAGLYAVTPDATDTADLAARVDAAIAGGAGTIQYRAKSAAAATRREQAAALARIAAARGALFIVNDDAALAAAVGADGVHIGDDDGGIDAARRLLGPDAIVGVSCYDDFALGEAAAAAGADYVAFGSFFPSTRQARRAPGRHRAARARRGPSRAGGRDRRHRRGQRRHARRRRRRRAGGHQRGVRGARSRRRPARGAQDPRRRGRRGVGPGGTDSRIELATTGELKA